MERKIVIREPDSLRVGRWLVNWESLVFFDACNASGIGLRGEGHYTFEKNLSTERLVLGFGNIRDELLSEGLQELKKTIDRY